MSLERIIAFYGKGSQTGTAAQARYPNLPLDGVEESFEDIVDLTKNEPILGILPLWNSHVGEIKETGIFRELFDQNIKLEDLWPAKIKFQCLGRNSVKGKPLRSVVSVGVAEAQCCKFIAESGNPAFSREPSTIAANQKFENDDRIHAVLRVPKPFDKSRFYQIRKDASNPYNFTTFALFGNVSSSKWKGKKWQVLTERLTPRENNLIGVEMPIPDPVLSDEQNDLFDEIYGQSDNLDQLPRVIFIFDKTEIECGLLFEMSKKNVISGPINEDGTLANIVVKRDLGETKSRYKEKIFCFLKKEFSEVLKWDFIKHIGTKTCFFACPTFNIMTHGFNEEIVESVVKTIIFKYFQLLDNNLPCTQKQKTFFNKYRNRFLEKGPEFIKFKAL